MLIARRYADIKNTWRNALSSPHVGPAGLIRQIVRKRDFYAGLLMIFFGLVMALKGPGYRLGTLMHMGPGYLPTALGALLVCLGIAIGTSAIGVPEGEDEDLLPENREWFAWACILCSPLAFMLFGAYFGLAPGTFACVFVAALGDRNGTLRSGLALSAIITVFGVGLFSYVLKI